MALARCSIQAVKSKSKHTPLLVLRHEGRTRCRAICRPAAERMHHSDRSVTADQPASSFDTAQPTDCSQLQAGKKPCSWAQRTRSRRVRKSKGHRLSKSKERSALSARPIMPRRVSFVVLAALYQRWCAKHSGFASFFPCCRRLARRATRRMLP